MLMLHIYLFLAPLPPSVLSPPPYHLELDNVSPMHTLLITDEMKHSISDFTWINA